MSAKNVGPSKSQGPRPPAAGRPAEVQSRAATNVARQTPPAPNAARPPQAPPAYRPQAVPRVLQTKPPPGHSPNVPPAPNPPATRRTPPVAPPVYRPAPNAGVQRKEATPFPRAQSPAPSPFLPRVIQRMEEVEDDDAAHNWDNVVAKYNNRSAGREVEDAFLRAGFSTTEMRAAILRAMRAKGWANAKIAHSLGDQGSGLRGGTAKKIQDCKNDLIAWAQENARGGNQTGKKKNKKGRRKKDASSDDEGSDG